MYTWQAKKTEKEKTRDKLLITQECIVTMSAGFRRTLKWSDWIGRRDWWAVQWMRKSQSRRGCLFIGSPCSQHGSQQQASPSDNAIHLMYSLRDATHTLLQFDMKSMHLQSKPYVVRLENSPNDRPGRLTLFSVWPNNQFLAFQRQ